MPDQNMFARAYAHQTRNLLRRGWRLLSTNLYLVRQQDCERLARLEEHQASQRRQRAKRLLGLWHAWAVRRCETRQAAEQQLATRYRHWQLRRLLGAWRASTEKTKAARTWHQGALSQVESVRECQRRQPQDEFSTLLPVPVRLRILSYLGVRDLCRCAQVCRLWQDVAQAAELWNTLDLSLLSARVTDAALAAVTFRFWPILSSLSLRDCIRLSDQTCTVLQACQNIQSLNLAGCTGLRDSGIRQVTHACQALVHLNLSNCLISDMALSHLATLCHNLERLELAGCNRLTDTGVTYLSNGPGCRQLRWLDLSGCLGLTTTGIATLARALGAELRTIFLNDLVHMGDIAVKALVEASPNLEHISLLRCGGLGDCTLQALCCCQVLTEIQLSENPRITDVGASAFFKACKTLRFLVLNDCSGILGPGLAPLAARKLILLDLDGCPTFTDQTVKN